MIAAVLESGDLRRLYTALSLLVSAAVDGTPVRVIVMFGALGPLLDDDLLAAARTAPGIASGQEEAFARSLVELRDTAVELDECRIWACSAAVELTGADRAAVDARLAGIVSTPAFLPSRWHCLVPRHREKPAWSFRPHRHRR
jgi:peroxiredoxin family protein